MTWFAVCAFGCATALTCAAVSAADKAENRDREALRRVQQNAQKLQSEKAALEKEKTDMAAKLESATKELDALKGQLSGAKRRTDAVEKELIPLREEAAGLKEQLETARKTLADAQSGARQREEESGQNQKRLEVVVSNLRTANARNTEHLDSCVDRNQGLQQFSKRILQNAAATRACWDALVPESPKVGFYSVDVEKVIQDYEDKLRNLSVEVPRK